MSNSFLGKVKSTGASKMGCVSGSAKNYEHEEDKAKRMCRGGYADGGEVQATADVLPNPFSEVKPVKNQRVPRKPTMPPSNNLE